MARGNKKAYLNSKMKKGVSLNPGGITKEQKANATDFKDWAFEFWKEHKRDFEDVILSDQKTMMDFMKMVAGFVPQKQEVTGEDGGAIIINYPNGYRDTAND